jgi:hypothetical protein
LNGHKPLYANDFQRSGELTAGMIHSPLIKPTTCFTARESPLSSQDVRHKYHLGSQSFDSRRILSVEPSVCGILALVPLQSCA